MKSRDSKGRFKKNEGSEFILTLPSIRNIIFYISLLIIFLPWITIVSKFNMLEKLVSFFEKLFSGKAEDVSETGKKNGLFY